MCRSFGEGVIPHGLVMAWEQGSIDDRDERKGARVSERHKRDMQERERTWSMMGEHALHARTYARGLHSSAHGCARA